MASDRACGCRSAIDLGVAFCGGSDRGCARADDDHRLPPDEAGSLLRRNQQGGTRSIA